ncbi:MAG TPA: hypothetical protein VHD56_17320 [Tepidisphaeraceae bacterium]|nr:hypothetical protein [Tepidisphaeraceae bacterium]
MRLCISESGLDLVVTPYNEVAATHDRFRLTLRGASCVRLDVRGDLSPRDWSDLEVSRFDYRATDDRRLSGTLSILPGSAGVWSIAFENAQWGLEQLPPDVPESVE